MSLAFTCVWLNIPCMSQTPLLMVISFFWQVLTDFKCLWAFSLLFCWNINWWHLCLVYWVLVFLNNRISFISMSISVHSYNIHTHAHTKHFVYIILHTYLWVGGWVRLLSFSSKAYSYICVLIFLFILPLEVARNQRKCYMGCVCVGWVGEFTELVLGFAARILCSLL